jgi:hypothetical protein
VEDDRLPGQSESTGAQGGYDDFGKAAGRLTILVGIVALVLAALVFGFSVP